MIFVAAIAALARTSAPQTTKWDNQVRIVVRSLRTKAGIVNGSPVVGLRLIGITSKGVAFRQGTYFYATSAQEGYIGPNANLRFDWAPTVTEDEYTEFSLEVWDFNSQRLPELQMNLPFVIHERALTRARATSADFEPIVDKLKRQYNKTVSRTDVVANLVGKTKPQMEDFCRRFFLAYTGPLSGETDDQAERDRSVYGGFRAALLGTVRFGVWNHYGNFVFRSRDYDYGQGYADPVNPHGTYKEPELTPVPGRNNEGEFLFHLNIGNVNTHEIGIGLEFKPSDIPPPGRRR